MRETTWDTGILAVSRFSITISNIVLLPILTKGLGSVGYGIWVQAWVLLPLLASVLDLGLPNAMLRFFLQKDRPSYTRDFYRIVAVSGTLSLAVGAFFWFSAPLFPAYLFDGHVRVIRIVAAIIPIWVIGILYQALLQSLRKMRDYGISIIVQNVLELGLAGLFISFGWGIEGAVGAVLIVRTSLLIALAAYVTRFLSGHSWKNASLSQYLPFSLPLVPMNMSAWAVSYIDRFLIAIMVGTAAVGNYDPAYTIGRSIPLLIASVMGMGILPSLSAMYDAGDSAQVKKTLSFMLKALLMVCIPFVVGGYLLSGPILTAFTTPEMAEQGVRILPLVALALTIHGCKVVVSQTFCLEKRTKPMGGTYTLAAVANAVLTIALIPVWGIEGAAVATVAAYSLDFLATLRFATRELFPWPGWGSVAKIGTSTAIMAGAVILAGRATPSGLVVPLAAGVAAYGICVRALYVLDADERALLRSIMPGRGDAANNGGRIAIFGGQLERTDEFLAIKMRRFSEKVGADVYSASIGLGWRFTRRSGRYTLLNTTPYYRKTPVIGFLNKAWGYLAFKAWGRKYGTIVLPGGIESPLIKVFGASRCVPFVVGTIEDAQSLARARAVVPTLKGVIAETQASKRQLEELGLAPERIHVMTPMIDPAHLQPYPPPSEGPFYILFASSPVHTHTLPGRYHSKGVSLLLEAFSLLAETRDVRLTLVWRKDFLHELEEDIAKYGIGDKVAVADELVDMKEYYRSHHCVVIPYTDSAGGPHLPLSALEALGHGRPVVATGVEDLQAIADLGCGTIADDITPVALRNALAACMDNYAELQARTRVCSSSLLDEHKKKYTAVRTFLLSLPRGTRVEKKKTVKVAFVHASAIKNSRFIEERGAALMDRGHGVAFIGWNRYHDAPYTFGAAHIWRFQVPTPLDSPSYFLFLPIWWAWSLCRLLWYRPDAVVAVNADAVPPSIAYALLARRQLVHDLHDFYFYHFANKPAPIPQIVDLLTYQAIKRSSLIITISEEAIEDFISRHCIDTNTNKIMNYPCLPTPGELDILHHKELSRYESFTACFFGNISRDRYVREIIEAVCEVPKCGFLLAGPEMKKGALSECLELMEYCSSMEYLGYLMRDELLELTARCHCIVLLLDPTNPHHRIPVPNKMYEGVVCHTPVITTEGTSSADMVHRYGMGLVISDNSSATIAGALKSLSQDHHLWESCVEGCLKAERDIVGNYSFEETIEALEEVARRGG